MLDILFLGRALLSVKRIRFSCFKLSLVIISVLLASDVFWARKGGGGPGRDDFSR